MTDKVYVGDIGTEIIIDCGTDISSATATKIKVKKPSGDAEEWTAVIQDTNYLKYITVEGDFDVSGKYIIQSYIDMPGWKGLGSSAAFLVYDPFK